MEDAPWRASPTDVVAILGARHDNPFAVLGLHEGGGRYVIRALVPDAVRVEAVDLAGKPLATLVRRAEGDLFEGPVDGQPGRFLYRLACENGYGRWTFTDPYAFGPVLGPLDDHLLVEGTHRELYTRLGAHPTVHGGIAGTVFSVWAPNAQRVSVVGDFNHWDGRRHQMRKRVDSGIWEIFAPEVGPGINYKYEIIGSNGRLLPLKADPVGFSAELRPSTASVVAPADDFIWSDADYLARRATSHPWSQPVSIYEVHLGSWRRGDNNRFLSYQELADTLIPYVAEQGFTHIELMPINEHPLDASWGYQPIGLFAPTRRHGDPAGFAALVDRAHAAGIGVIIDWVPAHFPTDVHGLARFDGSALYEHADTRRGFHPDWNTAIYDFGRREVANFLIASALYWFDRFHIDGLRVDAVASMLYLDYSRKAGEWLPNPDGSNDNRDAVRFLQRVNELVHERHPGALMIAEESTAWRGVSHPTSAGGLGFGFKWNMGWMNDTLSYIAHDPVHRRWHHDKLTFGLLYAFAENFILPISHDEVVHGKGSLIGKMPGDEWQRFANARAYLTYMWGHPGKKLLFMGQEFGQTAEWNHDVSLDWHLLQYPVHHGLQAFVRDLNAAYRNLPALSRKDSDGNGFRWVVVDDSDQSVVAFLRFGEADDRPVAVIVNFTPVPRVSYRIGLPCAGRWREVINSDATLYGGSGMGNFGAVHATHQGSHGLPASAAVTIPPLGGLFLTFDPD